MPSISGFLLGFIDILTGHLALTIYLLAVTGERITWKRLQRPPFPLLSTLIFILLSVVLRKLPALRMFQYYICSLVVLFLCALWVKRTWKWGFWQSYSAVCMASIFQIAGAALSMTVPVPFAAAVVLHLGVSIAVSLLLRRLKFDAWFRLLLDGGPNPQRTALLLFILTAVAEALLRLAFGVQPRFLTLYYLLAAAMIVLMTALIVRLAQWSDAARKMRFQRDVIVQQQLYEQDLEMIRREARAFRHDYKNLLAGLSEQAEAGELEGLRRSLSELGAGFDHRVGEKIQASVQIGNLRIPEVRSLLLSKLAAMREKGVDCRLEALYPVAAVDMDVWDFVRCLGILIDNAAEAALDTERPWVEIALLAQERRVYLRVSNSCANRVEPGKMWDDGWSTKGAGRGLGLASYQRILEGYPNASPCASWDDGVFVQELTVEDRA